MQHSLHVGSFICCCSSFAWPAQTWHMMFPSFCTYSRVPQLYLWSSSPGLWCDWRMHSECAVHLSTALCPICGKFECSGARIETQASSGWVVGGMKVACVGCSLWAEEGEMQYPGYVWTKYAALTHAKHSNHSFTSFSILSFLFILMLDDLITM